MTPTDATRPADGLGPDSGHLAARVTEHIETMPLTREDHS